MKKMKKLIFTCLAIFFGNLLFAQTKIIAYKSHSGNMANFENAIFENKFDANFSNLGVVPQRQIMDASLDSVIIIDENKSVLITSSVCKFRHSEKSELWKPGRDTVYKHKLFSKRNVDSVKSILKRQYYFKNNMDSVIFLEYDKMKKQYIPLKNNTEKEDKIIKKSEIKKASLFANTMVFLVLGISTLNAFFSRRKNQITNKNL
jgi:hypothetical protein